MSKTKSLKNENKILSFLTAESNKKLSILGIAMILLGAAALIFHAFHGLGSPDESFYLTIPYRFVLGDKPFVDEWHVAQTSAFLQYLPVWLFVKLTGGTTGIILYFRLLFCACQTATSCYIFTKLKKYGFVSALFGALMFELCVPELVESLDYYTMSLMLIVIAALILFCSEKINKLRLIIVGFLFALAVTTEPSMAVIYLAYTVTVIVFAILKKQNVSLLKLKSWIYLTIGVLIAFVLFMTFILSQESLSEFIKNIPNIFNSTEYGSSTLFGYGRAISAIFYKQKILFVLSLVWLAGVCIDFKRSSRKLIWSLSGGIVFTAYIVFFIISFIKSDIMSILFMPYVPAVLAIGLLILADKKDPKLIAIWLTGFAYVLCLGITSEAMDYVGATGFAISAVTLIPATTKILQELDEIKSHKLFGETIKKGEILAINKIITITTLLIPLGFVAIFASSMLIGDTSASAVQGKFVKVDTTMESGPFKGIKTTEKNNTYYENTLTDIKTMEEDGTITIASLSPYLVLASEKANITYTSWYLESLNNTMYDYYDATGKTPGYIYIPTADIYMTTEPKYNNPASLIKDYEAHFETSRVSGKAGCILKVIGDKNARS